MIIINNKQSSGNLSGLQAPRKLSPLLAEFVGAEMLPRTKVFFFF